MLFRMEIDNKTLNRTLCAPTMNNNVQKYVCTCFSTDSKYQMWFIYPPTNISIQLIVCLDVTFDNNYCLQFVYLLFDFGFLFRLFPTLDILSNWSDWNICWPFLSRFDQKYTVHINTRVKSSYGLWLMVKYNVMSMM